MLGLLKAVFSVGIVGDKKAEDIKIPEAVVGQEDYYSEDGRLFCGICLEPKEAFFPKMGSPFDGKKHPVPCACERARLEAQEAERKQREHYDTVMRLRQNCFPDGTHRNANIAKAVVQQNLKQVCSKYVDHWQEAVKDGTGLIFWDTVGTGKSFMAAAIANMLIEQEHIIVQPLNTKSLVTTRIFNFEECTSKDIARFQKLTLCVDWL